MRAFPHLISEVPRLGPPARGNSRRQWPQRCLLVWLICGSCLGCASGWRRPAADTAVLSRQLSLRGVDAVADERWGDAENWFRQAIETCPANEQARRQFADILWKQGRRAEALGEMEEAVRLSGGDATMMVELGRMYLDQGYPEHAERQVRRALQLQPQLAPAWALLGDVAAQQQRLDEALTHYHRALSYQPDYVAVQTATAQLYRRQGRPRRALSTLDAIAERRGPNAVPQEVLVIRGLALQELGRLDEAVETLASAVPQGPPNSDLYYQLAQAHWAAGDPSSARLAAQEALRLSPQHPSSLELLAQLEASGIRTAQTTR